MRLYYEIAVRSFRRGTAYRSAMIAGMLTNAFFGAVRSFVYIALYAGGGAVAGYTLEDVIGYTWITQSLISIGAGWLAWDIGRSIYSGDVVTDLSRPWSFYGYWLSRTIGEYAYNLLVRGSLTYLLGVLLFDAPVPTLAAALAFVPAICLAMLISFAFSFIVNMSAFWLIDNTGAMMIANVLLSFLSGFMIPIAFFPPWLALIAQALPFQAISGLPAQVFLGQISGFDVLPTLALQTFWAVALVTVGLFVQRTAMNKLTVQGG
jgi:ABC-2 type transport system permease protein